jgi:hypothetical protein
VRFLRNRLFQIQEREGREYICLKECHEELEKPERYHDDAPESDPPGRKETTQVGHNPDEYHPREYIREKSKGEGKNPGEFSDEVKPSDGDVDDLFHDGVSRPIEEIVSEMGEKTLVPDSGYLRDQDYRHCHDDRRVEIRIDRAQVVICSFHHEVDPIESEPEHIGEENIDEETSDKRKKGSGIFSVFYGV